MINTFLVLMCLFYSIDAVCIEVPPHEIDVKGDTVEKLCGDKISITYSELITVIGIELMGQTADSQLVHFKKNLHITELQQQPLNIQVSNEQIFYILYVKKTLTVTASENIKSLCVKNITAKSCFEENVHILKKRSLSTQGHSNQSSSKKGGILFSIILTVGLLVVVVTTSVVSILSCCVKNIKYPTDAEKGKLTDDSFSSTLSSTSKISLPGMERFYSSQSLLSHKVTSPAQDIRLKASSPYHSEYISPSGLNIPHNKPPTTTTKSKIGLSTENIADWSADKTDREQIYHVLESPRETENDTQIYHVLESPRETETNQQIYHVLEKPQENTQQIQVPTYNKPRERAYFVLEVASDTPPNLPVTATSDSSEQIYHVLDPLYSTNNSEKACSLCSNALPAEESMYLVILPKTQQHGEIPSSQQPTDAREPIYHKLEQPSVICQSCLCAEGGDPIYHELERSPEPIYDKVKNLIRQGTSTISDGIYSTVKRQDTGNSDGSHIYSTVHSLDLHEPPVTTTGDSSDNHLLSVKKVPLGMTHRESSDYASIPDDDTYDNNNDIQKHQHNLTLLVNSLKTKLANQSKMMKQDNISTDNDDVRIKIKTRASVNERNKEKKKRRPISSPGHSTIVPNTDDQPVIIAQRKKSGSYHILNIEDIWQYQLANRYAPISVVKRRTPSPVKMMRKGINSVVTRESYVREYLKDDYSSDYEVPVNICPTPIGGIIPPPSVLKRGSLPRQNAIGIGSSASVRHAPISFETSSHRKGKRLYTVKSEPCLESISIDDDSNDYDFLDPLSPIPTPLTSPTKSPLKKSVSSVCNIQSPSKLRYIERYVPSTHLLYDEDDYDHMWDTEDEEENEEI